MRTIISRRSPNNHGGAARHAWSRVDLIVLLLIAIVLIGLAIPFVTRQHKNAQRANCTFNLQQLGKAIQKYNETAGFLPPARIADDYATWAVLVVPYLEKRQHDDKEHLLENWDIGKRYADQPAAVREAWLTQMFCPARQRGGPFSSEGDGDPNLPGAVGDYGCVSGDGRADRLWTSINANGPMILAEVVKKENDVILSWRNLTKLDQSSLQRGLSVTLLLGEKHVPAEAWGRANEGDGCIYNGGHPASSARVAGPGFGLAPTRTAPFNNNFGSYHVDVCLFLQADLAVRVLTTSVSEEVLGRLTVRDLE